MIMEKYRQDIGDRIFMRPLSLQTPWNIDMQRRGELDPEDSIFSRTQRRLVLFGFNLYCICKQWRRELLGFNLYL
jgi:hypothetical protein